ncbi:uncharacterized protein N7479_006698 [Penicillium vulpinum]|uniref:Uncharacterized protein n=1 Tax=Penicillium vulpinum TaxID=29845 RepID=A0A1V6RZ32_9EURO|nr:uncharacterized protein N7479_006698 [Penicillium vulpinum]KAJ5959548.1 hypothetical protein N7479_006698 [Penicillium vulpinum]OQE06769.1 hypothetical protein PENVUL_c016G05863 [Penicillium vulpinum]
MSLALLPTELILMIEENLERQRDRNAFIRTTPRFALIFDDQLYKHNTAHQNAWIILWAAKRGLDSTIRKCLRAGAKITRRDRFRSHLRDIDAPEALNVVPRHPKPHPLVAAAEIGSVACIKLILEKGVYPNLLDEYYETPMRQAAANGHVDVVKLLLEKDPAVFTGAFKLRRPIKIAAARGHLHVLKVLFSFLRRGDRHITVKEAAQIIMYEGLWHRHANVMEYAFKKGADPNDKSQEPTLQFSSDLRPDELPERPQVRLVQSHKSIEFIRGISTPGWSAHLSNSLHAVLLGGDADLLKLMLDRRCDVKKLGYEALEYAILNKDKKVIFQLMDMGISYIPRLQAGYSADEPGPWEIMIRGIAKEIGIEL